MAENLEHLKRSLSLLDYLRRSNWTARRMGTTAEFVGLCPFHRETRPSFYVNGRKNLFYCHGCGRGGDLIRFVELSQGLSFRQSVAHLLQEIPPTGSGDVLEQAVAFYQLHSTVIPKQFNTCSNGVCAIPYSSKNWASAMLPAEACGVIWATEVAPSIYCCGWA